MQTSSHLWNSFVSIPHDTTMLELIVNWSLAQALTANDISHKIDDSSGTIGRRYARTDEIAVPFGITIDFDTVNNKPATVTVRDRDSMEQIRIGVCTATIEWFGFLTIGLVSRQIDEVVPLIANFVHGRSSWDAAKEKYPKFVQQETAKKEWNNGLRRRNWFY